MKKQIFTRALLGFPLGMAVCYIITIAVSLIWADGYYTPCVPELKELMGSEINTTGSAYNSEASTLEPEC